MQTANGYNASQGNIVRSAQTGWQTEFFVPAGLTPQTNYTVWVTQGPKISGPIYMLTKSAAFAETCTFVHALPYCPLVSYPIPLPPPSAATTTTASQAASATPSLLYDNTNLPPAIASNITGTLGNFSFLLNTFPCGRDVYSPLHSCSDCMNAYRTWACYVSLPRCTEPNPYAPSTNNSSSNSNSRSDSTPPPQAPFALLAIPAASPSRGLGFPNATSPYTELLPCIETCNAVHRNCPPFLQWQCPTPEVNANESYALGVFDSTEGSGQGQGVLGWDVALGAGDDQMGVVDRWGNAWCNGA